MALCRLPHEILGHITSHLDVDDVFHMASACRPLRFLVEDDTICGEILKRNELPLYQKVSKLPASEYAMYLRCLHKERQALRSANPYVVAVVAEAESFIFSHGTLCYITRQDGERQIRIVDLDRNTGSETVINTTTMLTDFIGNTTRKRLKITLLHFCEGVLSLHYIETCESRAHWLVVVNIREAKVLTARQLDQNWQLFVRNDARFLYYGTHTDRDASANKRWVLTGYNIRENKWLDQQVHLGELVGSGIGTDIVFEIHNGMFYALSNQISHEIEELDWTSYYYSVRFRLGQHCVNTIETSSKPCMWRRSHFEGPIDERWGTIQLFEAGDGKLRICEGRMEWSGGGGRPRRTYYSSDLVFPTDMSGGDANHGITARQENDSTQSIIHGGLQERAQRNGTSGHTRSAYGTHHGDDPTTATYYTLSNYPIRSYEPGCNTYLDVVQQSTLHDQDGATNIHIRCGSRQLKPFWDVKLKLPNLDSILTEQQVAELYLRNGKNEIANFPPECSSATTTTAQSEQLDQILNPTRAWGRITGTADARSVVYSIGDDATKLKPVVLVSFDPKLRLTGLADRIRDQAACQGDQRGTGSGSLVTGRDGEPNRTAFPGEQETIALYKTGSLKRKRGNGCLRTEPALYKTIKTGYHFGRERPSE